MDKSEQYIKMCESAKEIQKSWQPDVGDWFLYDYRGTTEFTEDVEKQIWTDKKDVWERIQCLTHKSSIKDYVTISDSSGAHVYTMQDFFKHRHVFLPSQDYLQKMLGDIDKSCEMFIRKLNEFYNPERFCINREDDVITCKYEAIGTERRKMFITMEQITLAYVMNELYNKSWNGSEWIKIEESD